LVDKLGAWRGKFFTKDTYNFLNFFPLRHKNKCAAISV
jgi:hypothetical protein